LLLQIAIVINTTLSYALPCRKTPFKVFFKRKPYWIEHLKPLNRAGNVDDEDKGVDLNDEVDSEDEDIVLTEIEA
jgi:hypothetical protein